MMEYEEQACIIHVLLIQVHQSASTLQGFRPQLQPTVGPPTCAWP